MLAGARPLAAGPAGVPGQLLRESVRRPVAGYRDPPNPNGHGHPDLLHWRRHGRLRPRLVGADKRQTRIVPNDLRRNKGKIC